MPNSATAGKTRDPWQVLGVGGATRLGLDVARELYLLLFSIQS